MLARKSKKVREREKAWVWEGKMGREERAQLRSRERKSQIETDREMERDSERDSRDC